MDAGEVLAERYELQARLGLGGFGAVWRANDHESGGKVAVKVLADHHSQEPGQVKRFQREARALARLRHPNIVPILDSGVDRERHFIVMQLIEGESLQDLLRREGSIAPELAVSIGIQTCEALGYAHVRGVIHRDVKPANLMIVEGEQPLVMVTDFGIARLLDETAITASGALVGSFLYMAPELIQGEQAGPATDVYALGVVLYQCIAGRTPYTATSLPELFAQQQNGPPGHLSECVDGVDPALNDAIMRALEFDPARRHRSAAKFGKALGGNPETDETALLPPQPLGRRTATTVVFPGSRGYARRGRALVVVAILALALLVGLLLAATGGDDGGQSPEVAQEDRPQPRDRVETAPSPEPEPEEDSSPPPADRSRYSGGGYNAELVSVARGAEGFEVELVARGASDLRRPETSCVEAGGQKIAPSDVDLAADRPGYYAATLSFPYGPAGAYRFRYSCRRDYSAPFLFERSESESPLRTIAGTIGTSVYGPDPHYRAVVGPVEVFSSYFVVEFESRGYSDLRHPQESCVKREGSTIRPIGVRLEIELDTHYRGKMTFPNEGPGLYEFLYSCQSDYSLVPLFES